MAMQPATGADFHVGQRVRLHPASDLWMRGATHGTVRAVGRKWVHVDVEFMGCIVRRGVRCTPSRLLPLED